MTTTLQKGNNDGWLGRLEFILFDTGHPPISIFMIRFSNGIIQGKTGLQGFYCRELNSCSCKKCL